jgi:F-type H+-transporting ATPase subunit gamma
MANLKEIRTRLASVKTTRQITSAMKMVSAAKLRKAQDSIIQMRPYASKLQQILFDLAENTVSEEIELYKENRELNKVLLVVITSNKGLCGAFNANIVKKAISELKGEFKDLHEESKVDVLAIGKKGAELLASKKIKVTETYHELIDEPSYVEVRNVAIDLIERFVSGKYDIIKLYFNQFKNAATQLVAVEQYLPFPDKDKSDEPEKGQDYILEPSQHEILEHLIPKYLKMQLYKGILESVASEHGARMTAMHKATDNATDLIKEMQIEYNKARQASITNEILEIVSGAEALKG